VAQGERRSLKERRRKKNKKQKKRNMREIKTPLSLRMFLFLFLSPAGRCFLFLSVEKSGFCPVYGKMTVP